MERTERICGSSSAIWATGASVSAVAYGKSVDTSMGLTPLEGLIMGTRSGDMDPAIVSFLAQKEGLDAAQVIDICNKKSGVLGLSGGASSDFRDLVDAAKDGNELAKNALEAYAYRVGKYIGAYTAAMNGVDVIAFTAGVGENNAEVRALIGQYIGYLGTNIDPGEKQTARRGSDPLPTRARRWSPWWFPPTRSLPSPERRCAC